MAVNDSSSSFNSVFYCADSTAGAIISTAFAIANLFLHLPLSVVIVYLSHQRWRQQHSFPTTSHSDIFTYHSAAMVLIFELGFALYWCGKSFGLPVIITVGFYATCVFFPGQMCFHILTCVEHYLAVVHPVIYRGMRQSGGVRVRNIVIICVWLLCLSWIGLTGLYYPVFAYIPYFCLFVFSLTVVSFCSFSVLCALIRPGPGEMGGNQRRVDQTKQRAFNSIAAITGVLWVYFFGYLIFLAIERSHLLSYSDGCLLLTAGMWFILPSSLILPLLYLHRAGKLFCCHCSNE